MSFITQSCWDSQTLLISLFAFAGEDSGRVGEHQEGRRGISDQSSGTKSEKESESFFIWMAFVGIFPHWPSLG